MNVPIFCDRCADPIHDASAVEVHAYGKCGTLCARCMATALFGKKCNLCYGFDGELVKHGKAAWTHPECDARRANRWHKCGTCNLRTDDPATIGFLSATQCRPCVALRERYAAELRERADELEANDWEEIAEAEARAEMFRERALG